MFLSGNIVLLTFLYFIQGLPYGFQTQFLPFYMRSQGVELTNIGLVKLLHVPWLTKPFWAPLVDKYGTKKKWLLGSISALMATCCITSISPPNSIPLLCGLLFTINLLAATQDIVVDSIAISVLTAEELGQGNTAQVVGYKIGSVFGGGILVLFMDILGWTGLFLILALLYLEALLFVYVSPTVRVLDKQEKSKQSLILALDAPEVSADNMTALYVLQQNEDYHVNHVNTNKLPPSKSQLNAPNNDVSIKSDLDMQLSAEYNTDEEIKKPQGKEQLNDLADELDQLEAEIEQMEAERENDFDFIPNDADNIDEDDDYDISNPIDLSVTATRFSQTFPAEDLPGAAPRRENPGMLAFFRQVFSVPGTLWMSSYVLLYKLGEQGALSMLPLLMLDLNVSTTELTFWTGVIGQAVSVAGSVLGGWLISNKRIPAYLLLHQMSLLRLMPLGAQTLIIVLWKTETIYPIFYGICIATMLLLLLIGGVITTATFTFMMQCSRLATGNVQATHYTTLATFEVFGKLTFTAITGWVVQQFGYPFAFLVFILMSVCVVPLFKMCPVELTGEQQSGSATDTDETLGDETLVEEEDCDDDDIFADAEESITVEKPRKNNMHNILKQSYFNTKIKVE